MSEPFGSVAAQGLPSRAPWVSPSAIAQSPAGHSNLLLGFFLEGGRKDLEAILTPMQFAW